MVSGQPVQNVEQLKRLSAFVEQLPEANGPPAPKRGAATQQREGAQPAPANQGQQHETTEQLKALGYVE